MTLSTLTTCLLTVALVASGSHAKQETRAFTIEKVLHTAVSTMTHTVIVYPTCTTSVAGVTACPTADLKKISNIIFPAVTRAPLLGSPTAIPTEDGAESSTYEVAEVVLPSCDCFSAGSYRSARVLENDVITIRSTTVLTSDVLVTSTDHSTTVSITYNGCVPPDAPATATCDA